MVKYHRIDLSALITHRFPLSGIVEAYHFFGERRDGVMKVAVAPLMKTPYFSNEGFLL